MPEDYFGLDEPRKIDGTLIAFDFGTKRIGVAVGQSITQTANPISPLRATDGIPNCDEIKQLLSKWQPQALVVGMPVNEGYPERQQILLSAKKFARRLRHRYHLPVFGIDERLTTFEARDILFEQGGLREVEKRSVDSMAAALILESWLRTYNR